MTKTHFFKKTLPSLLVAVYSVFMFVLFFPFKKQTIAATPPVKYNIVIDAGHGGIDGGVSGVNTDARESDINLSIAKKLEKLVTNAGFNAVMTRDTSGGLYGVLSPGFKKRDMQKRKEIIEQSMPQAVISVHLNSCNAKNRRGTMIYCKKGDEKGLKLANAISAKFNESESKSRNCSVFYGDYFILNVSPCPAVICECGFLSNAEDEKLLLTDSYRDYLAKTIWEGVLKYLSE